MNDPWPIANALDRIALQIKRANDLKEKELEQDRQFLELVEKQNG